jgi:hypothetical protein
MLPPQQPAKWLVSFFGKEIKIDVSPGVQTFVRRFGCADVVLLGCSFHRFAFFIETDDPAIAKHYKQNLIQFIRQLRRDFESPDAKFVLATLGQTPMEGAIGNDAEIFNAQMSVQEMTEFAGNTSCVYSKPCCHGGASNSHYNGNAETYMDVGLAMGRAMASLLQDGAKT